MGVQYPYVPECVNVSMRGDCDSLCALSTASLCVVAEWSVVPEHSSERKGSKNEAWKTKKEVVT